MRVIVESDHEPPRPAVEEAYGQGAADGGRAPEDDAGVALPAEAAAIDAGPPPQELIEAIGERPPVVDIAAAVALEEGIDAGAPAESD